MRTATFTLNCCVPINGLHLFAFCTVVYILDANILRDLFFLDILYWVFNIPRPKLQEGSSKLARWNVKIMMLYRNFAEPHQLVLALLQQSICYFMTGPTSAIRLASSSNAVVFGEKRLGPGKNQCFFACSNIPRQTKKKGRTTFSTKSIENSRIGGIFPFLTLRYATARPHTLKTHEK